MDYKLGFTLRLSLPKNMQNAKNMQNMQKRAQRSQPRGREKLSVYSDSMDFSIIFLADQMLLTISSDLIF